jgi:hypothetical protein
MASESHLSDTYALPSMSTQMNMTVIAIVAALALFGVVAITVVAMPQEADARGCNNSIAFNASKGRCFQP